MGGKGYSVAFDPLDGSSIIDSNFAVGTIWGTWPGSRLTGKTPLSDPCNDLCFFSTMISMSCTVLLISYRVISHRRSDG
jgi:hypothetical protein